MSGRCRLKAAGSQLPIFFITTVGQRPCPAAFAIRVIAAIIAPGLATPLPAMSWALPCATDENRIGVPMVNAMVAAGAMNFAGT